MQRIDNRLVYSTTDIVGALECRHLAHLERAVVDGHLKRPMRTDPVLDRIAQRGIEHEVRFLAELSRDDLTVVKIPRYETLPRAERVARGREATIEAMREGADVIYQAVLFEGRCLGYADFLQRVKQPSELGPWSYEVWDTKLARHAKASAVLQLCMYSELVAVLQDLVRHGEALPVAGRRRAVAPMAGGVEAGDAMDDAGERGALVLLDEPPIADVLEPPVGDVGGDLLHGVEAEVAAVGKDLVD